jgi:cellulase
MLTQTLLTSVLFSVVSAHQTLNQIWINNETPGYQVGVRKAPTNSPVKDIKGNDMACNVPTNAAAVKTVEASAGDSIKVQWSPLVHPGPITHFLKPVTDAATDTGVGAGWFKIDELDFVDGKWASDVMIANNMTHDFKLPTGLASGEYLVSPHISMTSTKTLLIDELIASLRNGRSAQFATSRRR